MKHIYLYCIVARLVPENHVLLFAMYALVQQTNMDRAFPLEVSLCGNAFSV